jgi:hypothetical protein
MKVLDINIMEHQDCWEFTLITLQYLLHLHILVIKLIMLLNKAC